MPITKETTWTYFSDLHSGGDRKTDWEYIYIQGRREQAIRQFEELFRRDPRHVSCSCCGPDYSIYEETAGEDFDIPAHHERAIQGITPSAFSRGKSLYIPEEL